MSNKSLSVIGVDLGGTNMRAGLVENDTIVKTSKNLVPVTDDPDVVVDVLKDTIRDAYKPNVAGIGIGVPSVVDTERGIVYDVENIPSWKEVYLKDILEKEFKVPVYINNDANCFAVGERHFGAGKKYDDFVGLITGTGMGGGIIKNGHLLPDQNCGAGEFGIIPYKDHNLEYYCSGNFFSVFYGTDAKAIEERVEAGDAEAIEAMKAYGKHLGVTIKIIMSTLDPAAIIIGGGVSKSFHQYEKWMWEEINTFDYSGSVEKLNVIKSELDNIAILGASALYYDATES